MGNKTFAILICALSLCLIGCRETIDNGKEDDTTKTDSSAFAKGADISWVTEMEADGVKFYDAAGTETDCFKLMKSLGMNSIRLRVWVNPTNGWCNRADVVAKAKRAAALDMRVMIDFHYSDYWADPGKQNKPAAWKDLDVTGLANAVSEHTKDVLNALKTAGVTPEWVQIGNETSDGFLWASSTSDPVTCRASKDMPAYAKVTKAGCDAAKSVFPKAKTMIHIDNGWDDLTHFTWILDGLKKNGCTWDAIGLSLYPKADNYASYVTKCVSNIQNLHAKYSTPTVVCETGFPWDDPTNGKAFLTSLITKCKALGVTKCSGVFYWEPECYANWNSYTLGSFDNSGKPTAALDAFAD